MCRLFFKYFGLYLRSSGQSLKVLSQIVTRSDFRLTKITLAVLCRCNWRRHEEGRWRNQLDASLSFCYTPSQLGSVGQSLPLSGFSLLRCKERVCIK